MTIKSLISFVLMMMTVTTLVYAGEGDDLKKILSDTSQEYFNLRFKREVDFQRIKNPGLRARVEKFCRSSCQELKKEVPLAYGAKVKQKSCSDKNCNNICPSDIIPEVCRD